VLNFISTAPRTLNTHKYLNFFLIRQFIKITQSDNAITASEQLQQPFQ
jgi:hypothetical protein